MMMSCLFMRKMGKMELVRVFYMKGNFKNRLMLYFSNGSEIKLRSRRESRTNNKNKQKISFKILLLLFNIG